MLKSFIIFINIIIIISCNPYRPKIKEISYISVDDDGYEIPIPTYTNYSTNIIVDTTNNLNSLAMASDNKGKALMEGVYLTSPYGTYNGAIWKKVGNIQYWACEINKLFWQHNLVDNVIKVIGNIYTEATQIRFLSNFNSSYGDSRAFEIVLRGIDYKKNYDTNILMVYKRKTDEPEHSAFIREIRQRGRFLTYIYEEKEWFGRWMTINRYQNGEISTDGYLIEFVKDGRSGKLYNVLNGNFTRRPTLKYWFVKAFNQYEAIYREERSKQYLAISLKYPKKIPYYAGNYINDPNTKYLHIAPPVTYYQGTGEQGYTIVPDAAKYALLSAFFGGQNSWADLSNNLINLLKTVDFNYGNYKNNYKELSISPASESGWLYSKYYWNIEAVIDWGATFYRIYYQDEHGHNRTW